MSPRRRSRALAGVAALLGTLAGALAPAPVAGAAPRPAATAPAVRTDPRGAFTSGDTPNPPGAPGEKVVSLTFDDGPQPTYTQKVLDVLTRYGLRATFFEIGRQAEAHPDLVKAIVAQGSIVANHTWDHRNLAQADAAAFDFQVDHTTQVIESISGQKVTCIRPPYGATNPAVAQRLAARGLTSVLWTADSDDFAKPGVDKVVSNAMAHLQPGGIILFHDGGGKRDETLAALPIVIERIQAAGYRIAPVCAPDPHAPVGAIEGANGGKAGKLSAAGWASDPDAKTPVDVHLYVDGTFATKVVANGPGKPGPRWTAVVKARPGHHTVCAYAINVGPGNGNPGLGCVEVDVPSITAFDDLVPLAAQARYGQLRAQAVVLERVVRLHDVGHLPWRSLAASGLGRGPFAR